MILLINFDHFYDPNINIIVEKYVIYIRSMFSKIKLWYIKIMNKILLNGFIVHKFIFTKIKRIHQIITHKLN